jgi:hypothetical protein
MTEILHAHPHQTVRHILDALQAAQMTSLLFFVVVGSNIAILA